MVVGTPLLHWRPREDGGRSPPVGFRRRQVKERGEIGEHRGGVTGNSRRAQVLTIPQAHSHPRLAGGRGVIRRWQPVRELAISLNGTSHGQVHDPSRKELWS